MSALHATDGDMAGSASFRESFALLSKHGLSYDCWLYENNLDSLIALAKAFPETSIVVDHCGGPVGVGESREATLSRWTPKMQELAKASARLPACEHFLTPPTHTRSHHPALLPSLSARTLCVSSAGWACCRWD